MKKSAVILFVLFICDLCIAKDLRLWYDSPAVEWTDALPIGNGRLGAMIFGGPQQERIQINEETIWSGSPHNNVNYKAKNGLYEIRKALFDNRRLDALKLCDVYINTPSSNCMKYQTAGNVILNFKNIGNYSNYYRELNLENAISTTTFTSNGVQYKREALASFEKQVIAMHLTASKSGSISFSASYSLPYDQKQIFGQKASLGKDNSALLQISSLTDDFGGIKAEVKFTDCTLIKSYGGKIETEGNDIIVSNADSVTIYISIGTNYVNWHDVTGDEYSVAMKWLKQPTRWDKLKADNIKYYKKQFETVSFDLGSNNQVKKTTDKRVEEFNSTYDPDLIALYFQFGRYLLISCSQPGFQPANLQGVWNDSLEPRWGSKYTTNVNFEMNYWPAFVCGLSNNFEPFLQFVKDCAEHGKETGRMYGCRGWTVHHNTDIWRTTGMIDGAYWGMWPTGAAWLSHQLWDGYLFNQDKNYLKQIYPVMKSACEFFIDFLVEEPISGYKYLVVSPSNSPENTPKLDKQNDNVTTSYGTTMDNQLLTELFGCSIKAAKLMNENTLFIDTLEYIKSRLAPMKIGQWGQLQEWFQDWDDKNDKQRHVSHLWGLFPGHLITSDRTPELFEAAKTSLIARGDASTGWSMGWKVCLWARLLDGNHAYKLIQEQLKPSNTDNPNGGTYKNLFDAHPPFQIDGNFGCTAGIAEMLVQSHTGKIVLLPALPDKWLKGCIKGLRTRGGFIIEELSWNNSRPTTIKIKSTIGGKMDVSFNGKTKSINTIKGKVYDIFFE